MAALPADEWALVPPGDRHAQRRHDAVHAAAGPGDEGGRAPRARLVRGDEQLVAVAVSLPAPVGLRRAGVGGDDHREARPACAPAGQRAGLALAARHRPAGGRLELEGVHLEPGAPAVEQRHRDPHLLAGRHEPVVGAGLEHEALGEGERGLDVRLFLPQALGDLGARGGIGHSDVESLRERTHGGEGLGQSGHGPLGGAGIEGGPGGGRLRLQRGELGSEERAGGGERRERRVDAVEDVALGRGDRRLRVEEAEHPLRRTGVGPELSRPLAAVHRPRAGAELLPRHPEQRVVDAGGHADRRARHLPVAPDPALVDLPRLPRPQALAQLLREPRRVGRRPEGLAGEPPHRLVVLAAALALERQGEDHVGAEGADDAHDVAERLLAAPLREGLLHAEGEAELVGAAEVLLDPVVAVDRRQLPGAQHAERLEQLGPDRVLAALAAGHA